MRDRTVTSVQNVWDVRGILRGTWYDVVWLLFDRWEMASRGLEGRNYPLL